jgi:methylase of polypeptide subunit release factors
LRSARAFSLAAPHYDRDQRQNRIARWSRKRSLELLEGYFGLGLSLLEIGCGTGEEALHMARLGSQVVATDTAPGMVAILEEKLRAQPELQALVTPIVLPASELSALLDRYGSQSFDGAYSSFGPLNCEADLEPVASALSRLVKPGGYLVLSFINRYCAWETAWHLLKGQTQAAVRRWRGVTEATVRAEWQGERVQVYYPTIPDLERTFSTDFTPIRRLALPWLLPPQYLDPILRGRKPLFALLSRLDQVLAGRWPFSMIGDHVVLVLRRKPLSGWERTPLPIWRRAVRLLVYRLLLARYRRFSPGKQGSRWVSVSRERLWVESTVFDPSIHFTSEFLARYLTSSHLSTRSAQSLLDLGTGSGLLAIAAARAGATRVTAVDVNPAAVRSTIRNVQERNLASQVEVLQSDMFQAVQGRRFDLIVTNPPYYRGTPTGPAEQAYYAGPNLEWLERLAREAHSHLKPEGAILMVLGETAPIEAILALFNRHGWESRVVERKELLTEAITIFEFKPTGDAPRSVS